MNSRTINFQEEFSAKIPALTLLTNLGYTFIPPSECESLRGNTLAGNKSTHQVVLLSVMRAFLAKQRSEERRVGKSVDLGGRRIIKKIFFSSRRRHTR